MHDRIQSSFHASLFVLFDAHTRIVGRWGSIRGSRPTSCLTCMQLKIERPIYRTKSSDISFILRRYNIWEDSVSCDIILGKTRFLNPRLIRGCRSMGSDPGISLDFVLDLHAHSTSMNAFCYVNLLDNDMAKMQKVRPPPPLTPREERGPKRGRVGEVARGRETGRGILEGRERSRGRGRGSEGGGEISCAPLHLWGPLKTFLTSHLSAGENLPPASQIRTRKPSLISTIFP